LQSLAEASPGKDFYRDQWLPAKWGRTLIGRAIHAGINPGRRPRGVWEQCRRSNRSDGQERAGLLTVIFRRVVRFTGAQPARTLPANRTSKNTGYNGWRRFLIVSLLANIRKKCAAIRQGGGDKKNKRKPCSNWALSGGSWVKKWIMKAGQKVHYQQLVTSFPEKGLDRSRRQKGRAASPLATVGKQGRIAFAAGGDIQTPPPVRGWQKP